MKQQLTYTIAIIFLLLSNNSMGQMKSIPVITFNSCLNRNYFYNLFDSTMRINDGQAFEGSFFTVIINDVVLINNTTLEIKGFTCKFQDNSYQLENLKNFTGKRTENDIIDTLMLVNIKDNYSQGKIRGTKKGRLPFDIKINILKTESLFFYNPNYIVTEYQISKLRKGLLKTE